MKRKCIKFDPSPFIIDIPQLLSSNIELWLDESNAIAILEFINAKKKNGNWLHRNKFRNILYVALDGKYNFALYDKEEVSKKAKHVTAMKFKEGKSNIRIACKEFTIHGKKIIMVCLINKKSQGNDQKIKTIYETVGGYDYDIQ